MLEAAGGNRIAGWGLIVRGIWQAMLKAAKEDG